MALSALSTLLLGPQSGKRGQGDDATDAVGLRAAHPGVEQGRGTMTGLCCDASHDARPMPASLSVSVPLKGAGLTCHHLACSEWKVLLMWLCYGAFGRNGVL